MAIEHTFFLSSLFGLNGDSRSNLSYSIAGTYASLEIGRREEGERKGEQRARAQVRAGAGAFWLGQSAVAAVGFT